MKAILVALVLTLAAAPADASCFLGLICGPRHHVHAVRAKRQQSCADIRAAFRAAGSPQGNLKDWVWSYPEKQQHHILVCLEGV